MINNIINEIINYIDKSFIKCSISNKNIIFINNSINNKNYTGYVNIDSNQYLANGISNVLKRTIKKKKHYLYSNDVRHIINNHSNENKERLRSQLPITSNDIGILNYIINNHDSITYAGEHREGQVVKLQKRVLNYEYTVIEIVAKKNKTKIKTMWKSTLDDDLKIPILTPEAQVDITALIDLNISNNNIDVKHVFDELLLLLTVI